MANTNTTKIATTIDARYYLAVLEAADDKPADGRFVFELTIEEAHSLSGVKTGIYREVKWNGSYGDAKSYALAMAVTYEANHIRLLDFPS